MTKITKFAMLAALATTGLGAQASDVTIHTPAGYQVLGMSPNGKWACGVFVDAASNTYGFRWNLEGGSIELLDTDISTAWDIANDGTVSGDFSDKEVLNTGAPIEMPGYWRDGKWHHLEMPKGTLGDGVGGSITPDGRYMVGAISVNGIYTPFIWEEGKISRNLATGKDAIALAISPDGQAAAGYSTRKNRTVCYWPAEGEYIFLDDANTMPEAPWCYARNFSADGTKLLYWGGWDVDEDKQELYIYTTLDIASGERIKMKMPSMDSACDLFDISNDGTIVGEVDDRGYIFENGEGMFIDDFLACKGVDLSKYDDFYSAGDYYAGQLPIYRVVAISGDSKTMAMQYYNKTGEVASMVLKLDHDASTMPPAEITARQLSGLTTVGLNWKAPVGASGLRGYNVYRNNVKVSGFLPINRLYFYDKNLAAGNYEYVVGTVNAAGVETKSEPVSITVNEITQQANPPRATMARQKGVNNALVAWDMPQSNMLHLQYADPDAHEFNAFGIYAPVVMEAAVRFDKNELANYGDAKITELSFFPMAHHEKWELNLYSMASDGTLRTIASQEVTQDLTIKRRNTVKFDEPVAIPTDGDLIAAVCVTTTGQTPEVYGTDMTRVTPGYSDLLRLIDDPEYISAYENSLETALTLTVFSWAIDLGITPANYDAEANELKHYNIYICNNEANLDKIEGITGTEALVSDLNDGEYTFGVEAVYASGAVSEMVTADAAIAAKYPTVKSASVVQEDEDEPEVTARWATPLDNDATTFAYTTASKHSKGIQGNEANDYALTAAVEFPATRMRGFDGYQIESVRFYPLCDATYTIIIQENNDEIYAEEVADYEIGKWNEVMLSRPVYVNDCSNYRVAIDVFNPEPDVQVLGLDNKSPIDYLSNLYSTDGGYNWESLHTDAGLTGNWLIDMTLVNPDAEEMTVSGYDVVIDGKQKNESMVSGNEYSYRFESGDNAYHTLRIDVYYPAREKSVKGKNTEFYLSAAIADNIITDITLHQGENVLRAEGDGILGIEIHSMGGMKMTSAEGASIGIDNLIEGIYVVTVKTNSESISRKIRINK